MRVKLGLPAPIVPIFWGMVFLEATFGAYLSVWPLWIERLGAPITVVGLVLGSSGFIRLLVLGPSAAIADRFGYRNSILACRAATGIGLLTAAAATHWTHLVPMLIGAAIGELVFPLVQVLVAAQAGAQKMRSFALVFTVGPSISLIAAPLISGGLVAMFGIRAAFVFAAVCTFASLYFLAQIQEPASLAQHPDRPASTYLDAIRDPGVRMIGVLLFATVFTLSLGVAFIPTYLENVRGMAPAVIASVSAAAAVGTASLGLALARLPKLQRSPFLTVAIAIFTIAVALLIFRSTAFFPLMAIAFYLRGGMFSAWATHNAALGVITPADHRVRAFALIEMVGGIAFALGPVVAGPLYARRPTLPFDVSIAMCTVLIPVMLVYAQRRFRALQSRMSTAESTHP